jgi:hypothetical protein
LKDETKIDVDHPAFTGPRSKWSQRIAVCGSACGTHVDSTIRGTAKRIASDDGRDREVRAGGAPKLSRHNLSVDGRLLSPQHAPSTSAPPGSVSVVTTRRTRWRPTR